jgi:hypothetical protein
MLRYAVSAGFIAIVAVLAATGFSAPPKATTRPSGDSNAGSAPIIVKSVSGIAQRRAGNVKNSKWVQMKIGDIVSEHSLIRTGLGGKVVLKFADRGDITIKSGTKIGIGKNGKGVKSRLGLKYGSIRPQVESSRGANDFRVRTAADTLSAGRGGGNMSQWGDFSFQAVGSTIRPTIRPAIRPTTRPTTRPAPAASKPSDENKAKPAPMKVTVKLVSGIAEKRDADVRNGRWKRIKVGDVLSEDTVIRTGIGGRLVLKFADGGHAIIKSGTKVAISSIKRNGKPVKAKTRFGLTYAEALKAIASMSGDESRVIQLGFRGICYSGGSMAQWGANPRGPWALKVRKGSESIHVGQWDSRVKADLLRDLLSEFGEEAGQPYVELVITLPPRQESRFLWRESTQCCR